MSDYVAQCLALMPHWLKQALAAIIGVNTTENVGVEATEEEERMKIQEETRALRAANAKLLAVKNELQSEVEVMDDVIRKHSDVKLMHHNRDELTMTSDMLVDQMMQLRQQNVERQFHYDKKRESLAQELTNWQKKAASSKADAIVNIANVEVESELEVQSLTQSIARLEKTLAYVNDQLTSTHQVTEQQTPDMDVTIQSLKQRVAALEQYNAQVTEEADLLHDTNAQLKQRIVKKSIEYDTKREVVAEKLSKWKNRTQSLWQ